MQRQGVQYMIVIEDTTTNKIAAIGSVLVEKKFTHHISHVSYKNLLYLIIRDRPTKKKALPH